MSSTPDLVIRAEVYKDTVSTPATLFFNYPQSDTQSIDCGILFDNDAEKVKVHHREDDIFQVRAKTWKNTLWIPKLKIEYGHRDTIDSAWRGVAELLVEGDLDDFPSAKGSFHCYARLQDNALFSFYDSKQLTSWVTPFGKAELVHNYRYGGFVYDMSDRKPKKYDLIHIEVDPTKYDSLYELVLQLSAYLDEIMWLISFLCKKYVHWYQFDAYYKPSRRKKDKFRIINVYRDPTIVQRNKIEVKAPGFENHPAELLIQLNVLRSEVAQEIFTRYTTSKYKHIIKKLIVMILITFTDNVFEEDLGVLYTALETLVNEFSKPYSIGSHKFKKLRSALEDFLNSQHDVELTEEQLEQLMEKLPELRRYSYSARLNSVFVEKLKSLPQKLGYKLTPEILLESLKLVIRRRNDYIHAGRIEDYQDMFGDSALIRFLISIWILDLLGYPLNQISDHDPDLMDVDWALNRASYTPPTLF